MTIPHTEKGTSTLSVEEMQKEWTKREEEMRKEQRDDINKNTRLQIVFVIRTNQSQLDTPLPKSVTKILHGKAKGGLAEEVHHNGITSIAARSSQENRQHKGVQTKTHSKRKSKHRARRSKGSSRR